MFWYEGSRSSPGLIILWSTKYLRIGKESLSIIDQGTCIR